MSLALDSLACDLYGSKRCLIAWHVVLGMMVKVFICEIICKRNNAWCVGRADFVKTRPVGRFGVQFPRTPFKFILSLILFKLN
jgi:hypothetical protein